MSHFFNDTAKVNRIYRGLHSTHVHSILYVYVLGVGLDDNVGAIAHNIFMMTRRSIFLCSNPINCSVYSI